MKYSISHAPSYTVAEVSLAQGESIRAEADAMVAMSPTIEIDSQMSGGGFFKALKTSVLGGESFFQAIFTATGGSGTLLLAPSTTGDIIGLELHGEPLLIQSGSYLACDRTIELDTNFAGGRGFFSGEGLFLLKATGNGTLLLSSFGAILKKTLASNEQFIVDTGHIVAFDASVRYTVRKAAKKLLTSITSGEGLVCEYTGPGNIYMQTRNPRGYVSWLLPMLPKTSG